MPEGARTAPSAEPSLRHRAGLIVLLAGALGVVLVALPYPQFDLDRHSVPKEAVLHLTAGLAAACCLRLPRRLEPTLVDLLLAGYLALGFVSAAFADNWWLAARALGLSVSGALIFWSARAVARAGLAQPLLRGLAAVAVVGALTGLLQAYGVADQPAVSRAPGGTFGNRNFMAHFVALGVPLLLLAALEARRWVVYLPVLAGAAVAGAALLLSRSRAAWLATAAGLVFVTVEGFWLAGLGRERPARKRAIVIAGAAVVGVVLALAVPNRLRWRSDSPYLESLRNVGDYQSGSGRGRLIQYGNTLRMAARNPGLGVGPGNWAVAYPAFTAPGDPAFEAASWMPTNPWPSSDWMALVAERGVPAVLLLGGVGGVLLVTGWRRFRREANARAAGELTLVALLVVAFVVGAFDAVLLLPAPTLFVWAALGALAPEGRVVRHLAVGDRRRRWGTAAVVAIPLLLALRSGLQAGAMALASDGGTDGLERAAALDPGSYRIRMLAASTWIARGRCERGRPHAEAAARLFPKLAAPKRLARPCGKGRPID